MLPVSEIRDQFPIYKNKKDLIYLDSASTTQKPQKVIDALAEYYSSYNANVHRALYEIGDIATNEYEGVRNIVRKFFNVPDTHEIIFTSGTTESINLVAYSWGMNSLNEDKGVLITEMEHHSNLVPWQIVTEKTSSPLKYISINRDGTLDLTNLNSQLENSGIVAVVHQSNVFGTINPIKEIIDAAKSKNIITLVDGAQAAPHFPVDISKIDCDFYTFSGHKMIGPTGAGVLIGRKSLLEDMNPFMGGGEMINMVELEKSSWNEVPWKFEAGTPNIAQVIGLGEGLNFLSEIGMQKIKEHEDFLLKYALEALSEIDGIKLYGDPALRGAVVPFNIDNIHSHDLAKFVDTDNICIRAGHHCAQPIMNALGISSSARASFYIYNDTQDIDLLIKSIKKTVKIFS